MEPDQSLQCPISHEPFQDPRFLDCGHTFDKASLSSITNNECPLCKKKFILKNNGEYSVNWIVVSLLKLDIKTQDKEKVYTTEEAQKDYENYVSTVAKPIEDALIELIESKAKEGETTAMATGKNDKASVIRRVIENITTKHKFKIDYRTIQNGIQWTVQFHPKV